MLWMKMRSASWILVQQISFQIAFKCFLGKKIREPAEKYYFNYTHFMNHSKLMKYMLAQKSVPGKGCLVGDTASHCQLPQAFTDSFQVLIKVYK